MTDTPAWIILVTIAFAALGAAAVLLWARSRMRRAQGPAAGSRGVIEMRCGHCQHTMIAPVEQLVPLSPPELALAVRVRPEWVKRKLSEYICPHCASAHVFAVDVSPPAYLGEDLYTPKTRGNRCMECGKALQRPAWAKGEHDNNLKDAPLSMDHGLECQFCKSVFCYECAERVSRTRKKDGSLICPRCFRHPVVNVYHN